MTMEELLKEREDLGKAEGIAEGKAEGIVEGKAEGQKLILELTSLMAADGLFDELGRLKEDENLQNAMLEKYHLMT